MLARVIRFASKAHGGQVRRNGDPFVCHLYHVANELEGKNQKILAILHDVVEKTEKTWKDVFDYLSEIYSKERSMILSEGLNAISKAEDETYDYYIARCGKNDLAREVKICDIKDNLKDCKEHKRKEYTEALAFLEHISDMKQPF